MKGRISISVLAIIFSLVLLNLCLGSLAVYSQVNTESIRSKLLKEGLSSKLSLSFGYYSGNTNFFNLKADIRLDYHSRSYYSFLVGSFKQGKRAGEIFLNKGFVHIRGVKFITQRILAEAFAQKEFNDFTLLKDRSLIGCGTRIEFFKAEVDSRFGLNLGIGVMWEKELVGKQDFVKTEIFRSTNYLTFDWALKEDVKFSAINYYQFDILRFSDYRILSSLKVSFHLSERLIFTTFVNFRYDNEPPEGVKKYDLEVTNGLTFKL
jgi:putative salt-induced outer membrane protein YdiY